MPTSKPKMTAEQLREAVAIAMTPANGPPKQMTEKLRYTLLLVQNTDDTEAELLRVMVPSTKLGAKGREPVKVRVSTYDGGVTLETVAIVAPIFNEFAEALVNMYEKGAVYQLDFNAHEIKPIWPGAPLPVGNPK